MRVAYQTVSKYRPVVPGEPTICIALALNVGFYEMLEKNIDFLPTLRREDLTTAIASATLAALALAAVSTFTKVVSLVS